MDENVVFDTIYNQVDFHDIADYLNDLFSINMPDSDDLEFCATRYGEELLICDPSDWSYHIKVPISYADDFRNDVSYYFDDFFDCVDDSNIDDNTAVDMFMYWWCYTRARYLIEHRLGIELLEKDTVKKLIDDGILVTDLITM